MITGSGIRFGDNGRGFVDVYEGVEGGGRLLILALALLVASDDSNSDRQLGAALDLLEKTRGAVRKIVPADGSDGTFAEDIVTELRLWCNRARTHAKTAQATLDDYQWVGVDPKVGWEKHPLRVIVKAYFTLATVLTQQEPLSVRALDTHVDALYEALRRHVRPTLEERNSAGVPNVQLERNGHDGTRVTVVGIASSESNLDDAQGEDRAQMPVPASDGSTDATVVASAGRSSRMQITPMIIRRPDALAPDFDAHVDMALYAWLGPHPAPDEPMDAFVILLGKGYTPRELVRETIGQPSSGVGLEFRQFIQTIALRKGDLTGQ